MNLHEYQSKELFSKAGIPILNGEVASNAQQAKEAAQQLQGNQWVIKAQIHAGGRGKAGGIQIANSLDEVEGIATKMLGSRLITKQTDPSGPVSYTHLTLPTNREV